METGLDERRADRMSIACRDGYMSLAGYMRRKSLILLRVVLGMWCSSSRDKLLINMGRTSGGIGLGEIELRVGGRNDWATYVGESVVAIASRTASDEVADAFAIEMV